MPCIYCNDDPAVRQICYCREIKPTPRTRVTTVERAWQIIGAMNSPNT